MNRVELTGRIVNDLELRSTGSSCNITNTLAVKRQYKNKEGNYDSDFIRFVVWSKSAEFLKKYAGKGDLVALSGRWQHRSYDGSDGTTKYIDELVVENCELLSKAGNHEKQSQNQYEAYNDIPFENDLPF